MMGKFDGKFDGKIRWEIRWENSMGKFDGKIRWEIRWENSMGKFDGKFDGKIRWENSMGKFVGKFENYANQKIMQIRKYTITDHALWAASPRPAYRPPGVWPPAGRDGCFFSYISFF
jgi:hypothetical protein